MEQSHSLESDARSVTQEITYFLWNCKVHYRMGDRKNAQEMLFWESERKGLLKLILKKCVVNAWTECIWLRIGGSGGLL
jgi:hypothetical protein